MCDKINRVAIRACVGLGGREGVSRVDKNHAYPYGAATANLPTCTLRQTFEALRVMYLLGHERKIAVLLDGCEHLRHRQLQSPLLQSVRHLVMTHGKKNNERLTRVTLRPRSYSFLHSPVLRT